MQAARLSHFLLQSPSPASTECPASPLQAWHPPAPHPTLLASFPRCPPRSPLAGCHQAYAVVAGSRDESWDQMALEISAPLKEDTKSNTLPKGGLNLRPHFLQCRGSGTSGKMLFLNTMLINWTLQDTKVGRQRPCLGVLCPSPTWTALGYWPGVVKHSYNPSTLQDEAGGSP